MGGIDYTGDMDVRSIEAGKDARLVKEDSGKGDDIYSLGVSKKNKKYANRIISNYDNFLLEYSRTKCNDISRFDKNFN
jgi:hypothetical protein